MKTQIILFLLCFIFTICDDQSEKKKLFTECVLSQVGKPFQWGGEGPESFDILGLAKYCAKNVSLDFPSSRVHNDVIFSGKFIENPEPGDFGCTLIYQDLYHIYYIIVEGGEKPKAVMGEYGQALNIGYPSTFLTKYFKLW